MVELPILFVNVELYVSLTLSRLNMAIDQMSQTVGPQETYKIGIAA